MSFAAAARALRASVADLKALVTSEVIPLLSRLIKQRYSAEAVKAMVELTELQRGTDDAGAASVPRLAGRCKRCADALRELSQAFPETSAHWIAAHMVVAVFCSPAESSRAAALPLTTLLQRVEAHLPLVKKELSYLLKLVKALDKVGLIPRVWGCGGDGSACCLGVTGTLPLSPLLWSALLCSVLSALLALLCFAVV